MINAVAVKGNPLEDIGKGHPEKQGRSQAADENAGIP